MAKQATFDGLITGESAQHPAYVRATTTQGVVDIVSRADVALHSAVSADNMIYSVLSAAGDASLDGYKRRAAAYLVAVPTATAAYSVTRGTNGGVTLVTAGLYVENILTFVGALLDVSGYEGLDMAKRRQAVQEATVH